MKSCDRKFYEKVENLYGGKYKYLNLNHPDYKYPVLEVVCPTHGVFHVSKTEHVSKKKGCPFCDKVSIGNKFNIMKYLSMLFDNVTVFEKRGDKVYFVCEDHGFGVIDYERVSENPCKSCERVRRSKYYLDMLNGMYINLEFIEEYNTPITFNSKIKYVCNLHGENTCNVSRLISNVNKFGCRLCGQESKLFSGGWSVDVFQHFCNEWNGFGRLYVIHCYGNGEDFIKVGITCRDIDERFRCNRRMPYSYDVLLDLTHDPTFIFNMEKSIHKKYKSYRYKPELKFSGSTLECYDVEVFDSILNEVNCMCNSEGYRGVSRVNGKGVMLVGVV